MERLSAHGPVAEKTPGQIDYEKFCEQEYRQHGRVWNRWETLTPEEAGKWEASAMIGRPAADPADGQDCQAPHCPPSATQDCDWPRCAGRQP